MCRPANSRPYTRSNSGCPASARWMRIWCRPVSTGKPPASRRRAARRARRASPTPGPPPAPRPNRAVDADPAGRPAVGQQARADIRRPTSPGQREISAVDPVRLQRSSAAGARRTRAKTIRPLVSLSSRCTTPSAGCARSSGRPAQPRQPAAHSGERPALTSLVRHRAHPGGLVHHDDVRVEMHDRPGRQIAWCRGRRASGRCSISAPARAASARRARPRRSPRSSPPRSTCALGSRNLEQRTHQPVQQRRRHLLRTRRTPTPAPSGRPPILAFSPSASTMDEYTRIAGTTGSGTRTSRRIQSPPPIRATATCRESRTVRCRPFARARPPQRGTRADGGRRAGDR